MASTSQEGKKILWEEKEYRQWYAATALDV